MSLCAGMNGDLISRSELLDEIYGNNRPEVYDGQDIANWQMECINSAPAVDAEPVRHGRWKYLPPTINSVGAYSCSACGFLVFDHRVNKCNYCPNCGARMEAEVNDHGSDSTEHVY